MAINPLEPVRGQTAFALRQPELAAAGQTAADIDALPSIEGKRLALARMLAGGQGRASVSGGTPGAGPRPIDMGYADEAMGVGGLLAGGLPGLAMGAANMGVRANNMAFRDNVRRALGMEPVSFGRRLGGIFGFNDEGEGHGMIGRADIGGRNYGVSIGGGVYDGRTTLTADEAMKRAAIARGLEQQKKDAANRAAGASFSGATAAARAAGAFDRGGGGNNRGGGGGGMKGSASGKSGHPGREGGPM